MEEELTKAHARGSEETDELRFEQCLVQMRELRDRMTYDQNEIDRLKAETRAILSELRVA